jgi:predicted nucleotidyltransferase
MSTSIRRALSKAEFQTANTALREFQAGLERLYGQDRPAVRVYGSYARGQPGPESDIDLLLLFPQEIRPGEEIRRVNSILADLNLRYGVLISILPASESRYLSSADPFWQNVRRESRPIEVLSAFA